MSGNRKSGRHRIDHSTAARKDRAVFSKWLEETQPDVIFTLYHEVKQSLQDLALKVPQDIGLIQYEWRADHGEWAGMDQRNDPVGEPSMDCSY